MRSRVEDVGNLWICQDKVNVAVGGVNKGLRGADKFVSDQMNRAGSGLLRLLCVAPAPRNRKKRINTKEWSP